MKPSLLIIGGSYFAGRVLVEEMLNTDDYELFVLNRGNRPLNLGGITELKADRNDAEALRRVLPDEHWAGVIDFCGYSQQAVETLMSVLRPGTITHYIFISSSGVYRGGLDLPLTENAPLLTACETQSGSAANFGINRGRAEESVTKTCRQTGTAWTILRPALLYGRYNYAPGEAYFFDLLTKEEPVIIPKNNLALSQFLLVEDLARVIRCCLRDEFTRNTVFNVAAPDLISYDRFISVLEELTGDQVPVVAMDLEQIQARGIPLPFPADRHTIISSEKLIRALSIEYTGFSEGLRRTWEWFTSNSADERA